MNSKSALGIGVFFVILLCIFHMYQRAEITDLSSEAKQFIPSGQEYGGIPNESDLLSEKSVANILQNSSFSSNSQSYEDTYQHNLMTRLKDMYGTNSAYFDYHLEVQRKRHDQLHKACDAGVHEDHFVSPARNIWVNEKYQFLYCSIPKVACTSWKSVLLVLDGVTSSTDTFSQKTINRRSGKVMKQLWKYPIPEQKHILKTYTKFMFSREPFSRVLSAFRNKLSPNSTFERAQKWQQKLGQNIIKRFRGEKSRADQYDLKFSEFVRFINEEHAFNKHWNLQYKQCRPCDIDYTILGHFETLQEDSEFILKVIGAEGDVSFPSSNHSSPTNSSDEDIFKSFYETLSDQEFRALYKTYARDFEMFGYPLPDRI